MKKKDFVLIIHSILTKTVKPMYTYLDIPVQNMISVWQNYYTENEQEIDNEFNNFNLEKIEERVITLAKNMILEYLESIKNDADKLLLAKTNIKIHKSDFVYLLGRKKYSEIVA